MPRYEALLPVSHNRELATRSLLGTLCEKVNHPARCPDYDCSWLGNHLCSFPGAGFSDDNYDLVLSDDFKQLLSDCIDWQEAPLLSDGLALCKLTLRL